VSCLHKYIGALQIKYVLWEFNNFKLGKLSTRCIIKSILVAVGRLGGSVCQRVVLANLRGRTKLRHFCRASCWALFTLCVYLGQWTDQLQYTNLYCERKTCSFTAPIIKFTAIFTNNKSLHEFWNYIEARPIVFEINHTSVSVNGIGCCKFLTKSKWG
jgi:hypothetical protein